MNKNIFHAICNRISNEFAAEIDETPVILNVIGGITYKALYMNVLPIDSFVEVALPMTTILVPYENIISVEY